MAKKNFFLEFLSFRYNVFKIVHLFKKNNFFLILSILVNNSRYSQPLLTAAEEGSLAQIAAGTSRTCSSCCKGTFPLLDHSLKSAL